MPISYKSRLAYEVFHFRAKYYVTTNLIATIPYTLFIRHDIKGNLCIIHILVNCICPQCVIIILIKNMVFGNFLRSFNAKIVSLLRISGLSFMYKRDYAFMIFWGMSHPPVECWFMVNALHNIMLGSMYRRTIIEIIKFLPLR